MTEPRTRNGMSRRQRRIEIRCTGCGYDGVVTHVDAKPNVVEMRIALLEQAAPGPIAAADWRRFEGHVAEIFGAFGMNLDTPATRQSTQWFLKALYDSTSSYEGGQKLLTAFPTEQPPLRHSRRRPHERR